MATWAAALVVALARAEAAGRPARLTEPGLSTWTRFRGRLSATDLLGLLFEDAAVLHRIPFDAGALSANLRLDELPPPLVAGWLEQLPTLDLNAPSADFVLDVARALELPTRLARSELQVVKPHQKVLELPGTGGQLVHHLVSTQRDLTCQANAVMACAGWQELTLAGIVALDRGAPDASMVVRVDPGELRDPTHPVRRNRFDFVVGLHPDKGGLFRVEDQLAIWFPSAKVLLV
ncbi:MAG: hypothetical protein JNL79_21805 [Myxococcales bacterium]|nr:hypothetical protein [Myxococcales bacterium]